MARELHAAFRRRSRFDFDASDGRRSGVADVDHAGAEERLHLQVTVVVEERRRIHTDSSTGHGAFQATFETPGELGTEGPLGFGCGGIELVESAALETSRRGAVDERVARYL